MPILIPSDLHGHTLHSDGRATILEYVDFRRELGMRIIAIADHDHFFTVRRGSELASQRHMVFLPAAEITSFEGFGTTAAEQIHILAYFSPDVLRGRNLESKALYRRGLEVQETWRNFVLTWLTELSPDDRAAIDPEAELEGKSPGDFPGLQTMIERLLHQRREAYDLFRIHHARFWTAGKALFGWSPEDAIAAIRADGAVPIVAHPGRYRDRERTHQIIDAAGGLEVYTSRHKPEVADHFRRLAEEKNYLWTASSDDHQNAPYMRPPHGTPAPTLERILRRPLPSELVVQGTV